MPPMGAYSMYPFYQQQQYMVPQDHQGPPKPQPPGGDYSKSKDPPLDLMTKPQQPMQQQPLDGSKDSSVPGGPLPNTMQPAKPISQYYPFQ